MKLIDVPDKKTMNKEAYESLFKTWYEPLCQYAYSILKNVHESEDAVQKVFYNLWDERDEMEINGSIKSYLYRAVHNTSLNRIKHWKVQASHQSEVLHSENYIHNEVYENIIGQELSDKIQSAIETLPPKCKEVFILSRYDMLSYKEIALKLDISTNTVENQISKALKMLRQILKEFLPVILLYYLLKISGLC